MIETIESGVQTKQTIKTNKIPTKKWRQIAIAFAMENKKASWKVKTVKNFQNWQNLQNMQNLLNMQN